MNGLNGICKADASGGQWLSCRQIGWATAIIVNLVGLALIATGVASAAGAFSHMSQGASVTMMSLGGIGFLSAVVAMVLLRSQSNNIFGPQKWESLGLKTNELPMPQELREELTRSPNLMAVYIPEFSLSEFVAMVEKCGLTFMRKIAFDYGNQSIEKLTSRSAHWVLWRKGQYENFPDHFSMDYTPDYSKGKKAAEEGYQLATAVEVLCCLFVEYQVTGHLPPATIGCEELAQANLYSTHCLIGIISNASGYTIRTCFLRSHDMPQFYMRSIPQYLVKR